VNIARFAAKAVVASTLSLLATAGMAAPAEWPQWRGPNRDGKAVGIKLPATLPKELAQGWKVEVGEGYSSPVVAGGKVFIHARPEPGKESCLCFDAATGKPIWSVSYKSAYEPPEQAGVGKGPNSTPTVDGDRVYMLGLGGMFHCIEIASGKVLWKHDFQTEYWGTKDMFGLDGGFPVCGATSSPLVLGNRVVVAVGGPKAGAISVFDRQTGKLLEHTLPERSSYASPMVAKLAGVDQIVAFTGLRMVGVSRDKLDLLWDLPFKAHMEQTIITPVIWKDKVIVCGEAKPSFALKIEKNGDKVKATQAWLCAGLSSYMTTPVVMNDMLVGMDLRSRRIVGVNLDTGEQLWTSERLGVDFVSFSVVDGKLVTLIKNGFLTVGDVTTKGYTELARWKVGETPDFISALAMDGERVFVKDKTHLFCYSLKA
jgi:outer membrane protein assembly factor BamB